VEYFTIGHPRIIDSENATLLGLVWGVLATWWVGAILSVPLAVAARVGQRPKLSVASLIRPISILFCCNGVFASLAGAAGFVAASNGWVRLVGRLAVKVPEEKQTAYLVDLWAHSASYLGGFAGGLLLIAWVWRSRGLALQSDAASASQETTNPSQPEGRDGSIDE